jgi:hypothetical protein
LSNSAALQTFIDVADDIHHEETVKELLEITGNLPLAVSLIANVADSGGCDSALARWKSESTQMLSDGYDQRSSLDISIMLSFTSIRMTSDAQELLAIISMLPDGLTDAELVQTKLLLPNVLALKAILVRTSLAYYDKDKRIKVLAPIREHILYVHPPSSRMKLQLRQHFHGIINLWNQFKSLNAADIVPKISQNLGNSNSLLLDALGTKCLDDIQNFQSILTLNHFYRRIHGTYSSLLRTMSTQIVQWQDQQIFGDYLVECFETADLLPVIEPQTQIALGNEYFKSMDSLEQGGNC